MKSLLLLPFVLLMPAAHAVDYVKCDAMQKTLARLSNHQVEARKQARNPVGAKHRGSQSAAVSAFGAGDKDAISRRLNCILKGDFNDEASTALRIAAAAVQLKIDPVQADVEKDGCP